MPDERSPDTREMGISLTLAQAGVEMVAPLVVGLVVDYYADTSPWFLIAGIVLGFVGGMVHIVAVANHQERIRRGQDKGGSKPP